MKTIRFKAGSVDVVGGEIGDRNQKETSLGRTCVDGLPIYISCLD